MTKEKHFSTFWFLILILGIIWLVSELGYIGIDIPWLPIIVISIALGAFINRLMGRKNT
mgnify:CR=1 FL=1